MRGRIARTEAEWLEVFWSRVSKTDTCWNWTGAKSSVGYGYMRRMRAGSMARAHTISYELSKGPVPEGLQIDHLCRNKLCVNPEHLEAVTNRVNTLRGVGPSAKNAVKQFCKRGHPLVEGNLVKRSDGRRSCLICHNKASANPKYRPLKLSWWAKNKDRINAEKRAEYRKARPFL